jgi:hypothetical protein
MLKEHWAHLSRCQPNLLGPAKKNKAALQVKNAAKTVLEVTPTILRLLSPERSKTPTGSGSPTKAGGRKTQVPAKVPVRKQANEQVIELAKEQEMDQAGKSTLLAKTTGKATSLVKSIGKTKPVKMAPVPRKGTGQKKAVGQVEEVGQAREVGQAVDHGMQTRKSVKKLTFW